MALLVPDVGEVELLARALNKNTPDDVELHLYKTDVTPAEGDVVGDYTECDAAGYASVTLTGASWTVSTAAGTTTGSYAQQTFTFTAAQDVYGYYCTNAAGTVLLWAEKFSSTFSIPSGGGTIKVTPKITAD